MASSRTNKELLNLEQQKPCCPESRLVICSNNSPLPRKSKKKGANKQHECRPIEAAAPKSQVLGKVKNFLHEIALANQQLKIKMQEDPQENYDIETLSGNEAEIIEMDLLLGVAELQTPEALEAAEAAVDGLQQQIIPPYSGYMDSDDNSCSDDNEDSCSDDNDDNQNSVQPAAGDKPKKRPKIVVLN